MKLPYKIMSTAAMAVVLGSIQMISANAAVGDFYNQTTSTKYLKADLVSNNALVSKLEAEMDAKNVVIKEVSNGKYLDYDKANTAFVAAIADHVDPSIAIVNAAKAGKTEATKEILDAYKPATTKLTVTSVSAITTTAFSGVSTTLGFAVNGATTQADLKAVTAAGYTVDYQSTAEVTSAGVVNKTSDFQYKVVINDKDGKKVAESALQTVKVIDGALAKTLTDVSIVKNDDKVVEKLTAKTLVIGETYNVSINKYTTIKGEAKEGVPANKNFKYVTSDSSVIAITADGTKLVPLSVGTANITVTADNMETYTLSVTVKADARVAKTATTENISLSSTDNIKSIKVKVVDQYGDPVLNQAIYALAVKSGTDIVAGEVTGAVTDKDGITTLKIDVDTKTATTGSYIVKLSTASADTSKAIGQFTINYAKAADVVSYELRTTIASKSTDAAIDFAKDGKDIAKDADNSIALQLVGKDKDGVVGKTYVATEKLVDGKLDGTFTLTDGTKNFTGKLSGDITAVASSAIDGSIVLNATKVKTGKVTLTVTEGTLPIATYDVTVSNTTKPTMTLGAVGAFNVVDDLDKDNTTIKLTYANDAVVLGDLEEITFNMPVKVKAMSLGGITLTSDQIAQLTLKAGQNITSTYNSKIDFAPVTGVKVKDLVALGSTIKVTLENESGLDNTYTITLAAAPVAN